VVVIPALKQVPGLADVSTFGGETTEFQLALDPSKLAQYNLSLQQVIGTIKANNANAGGSLLVRGEQAAVIRGIGLIRSPRIWAISWSPRCEARRCFSRIWAAAVRRADPKRDSGKDQLPTW